MLTLPFLPQYSHDAVRAERPKVPCRLSIRPRLHHAGGDHESDRGDAATGGAADDDQENAGGHLQKKKNASIQFNFL